MAFTLETGVGVTGANAYLSTADFDTYWNDRANVDAVAASSAEKQAAIILASDYIDLQWRYRGFKKLETQGLLWPRKGVLTLTEQAEVDPDAVPVQVERTCAELAAVALDRELMPNVDPANSGAISTSQGAGPLKLAETFRTTIRSNPVFHKAARWLRDLRAADELLRA